MNSTGFYGVARWKKALSASLTIFALVASSAGSLFAFPHTALAAGLYTISGSGSVTGATVNLFGTATATPQTGNNAGQFMAVN